MLAIGTYPKDASLLCFRGRKLGEGSGVVEGAGKDLRHITLRAAGTPSADLERMVRRAFKLGGITMRGGRADPDRAVASVPPFGAVSLASRGAGP